MDNISYLFDIDGTLTEPRQRISDEFEEFFFNWMKNKEVYLVTGSDREKIMEQLSKRILDNCSGIFSSMANEFYINHNLIYENDLSIPKELILDLENFLKNSKYDDICSNNFEYRTGMLNFSIPGRSSSKEQRERYYEFDLLSKERKKITDYINKNYGYSLEAKIGGQISIDIQNVGNNKSLASKWIRKNKKTKIYFFGDKIEPDGNDYDIVKDIEKEKDGKIFKINSPDELKQILKTI